MLRQVHLLDTCGGLQLHGMGGGALRQTDLLPARPEPRRLLGGRPAAAEESAAAPAFALRLSRGMVAAAAGSAGSRCAGVWGLPLPRLSAVLRALEDPALHAQIAWLS